MTPPPIPYNNRIILSRYPGHLVYQNLGQEHKKKKNNGWKTDQISGVYTVCILNPLYSRSVASRILCTKQVASLKIKSKALVTVFYQSR